MNRILSGLKAWTWQRLSAVGVALYLIWAVAALAAGPTHDELRAMFATPSVFSATALFFVLLLVHAWVGIRDVVLDYIHPFAPRVAVLALLGLWLAGCGLWAFSVLVRAVV